MHRKLSIAAAVLLVGLVCILALRSPRDTNIIFKGRSAAEWFGMYFSTYEDAEASKNAFQTMGATAVPFLRSQLSVQDYSLRGVSAKLSREILPRVGVGLGFQAYPREIRARAAYLIALAGGKNVIPDLTNALQDPQPDVRIIAAEGLCSFGRDAQSAITALSSITNDMRSGAYYCQASVVSQTAVEAIRAISETNKTRHPLFSW